MPTVAAIALETLLEAGSSSAGSHQERGYSIQDFSSKEREARRNGAYRGSSASAFPKETSRHQPFVRREQQPIFLSRQTRDESNVSPMAKKNDSLAQEAGSRAKSSANGYYISPQLYATPEPTLIVPTGGISSSSPTSVSSPSPYVVNHKRRDVPRRPLPLPSTNNERVPSSCVHIVESETKTRNPNSASSAAPRGLANGSREACSEEQGDVSLCGEQEADVVRNTVNGDIFLDRRSNYNEKMGNECLYSGMDDDVEDNFFDPRELMNSMSSSDTEDAPGSVRRCGSGRCHTPFSGQSEFYDANEDFLSDGSLSRASPSIRASLEADLHSLRLHLLEEMERRTKAEEALEHIQSMIQKMGRLLSCPSHFDVDSAAQFCQEILFTRTVSEALETALAHAQNHEIARLHDRLQYYEAVNQEMSQRNQEAIELGRRQRQRRKSRRKWLVGCIGVAVTVGASLMAYSYLAAVPGGSAESSTLALIGDSHKSADGSSA